MSLLPGDVTLLLHRARDPSDADAREELFDLVKRVLYHIARRHMDKAPGHTLQATVLVDEAFCHLVNNQQIEWEDRCQFFRIAAIHMWRILKDHYRRRRPEKLPAEQMADQATDELGPGEVAARRELLLLADHALEQMEKEDPEACEVLRLYWFVNWQFRFGEDEEFVLETLEPGNVRNFEQVGEIRGISRSTANRLYVRAVKKLRRMLKAFAPESEGESL